VISDIDELILLYGFMVCMAGIGASHAGFGAAPAMIMFMFAAFFGAFPAYFFAQQKVLHGNIRIALYQSCS
jgi:hypothetical protein